MSCVAQTPDGHAPVRPDAHPRDGGVAEADPEPGLGGKLKGPERTQKNHNQVDA